MNQTVIGVFDTYSHAEQARQELIARGFSSNDVQVQAHSADISDTTGTMGTTSTTSTTTTGHDVGFMESVRNFFADIFGPDHDEAGHYSEAVRRGGAVVAVTVDDESRVQMAREALAAVGAVDIEKRVAEWRSGGYEGYRSDAAPYTADEVARERERVIPVVKEELEVGKRQVDLGTVRVVARTQETPVNESVTLREEHANIERRPVDRPASEADLAAFQDKTIEVRETAEKAVVNKTARVVEEVVVGKTATTDTQKVSDTVRETVVDVQRDGGTTRSTGMTGSMSGYDTDWRSHYDTNYAKLGGRYEDYQPAYQYGSTLASDSRYQGRSWDDIETNARSDWETRYPGSSWERFKAAVRHGWDRMTGSSTGSTYGSTGTTGSYATGTGTSTAGMTGAMSGYDTDWRSDYDSNYASLGGRYEDYQPAYQYGSTLASDNRYQGRSWDDIETNARSDWQTRYPGSDWNRFKAAVRHGWERMTGQR
ncbi:YsnF/AvaK domain-containing protein [Noviherbaspirillum pedocola]|uniref:YsnF/AvaK domain-containing protein n=1 Tax=Noviherbaspirillum pedocola TaxID=2801341 RepID=UPI001F1B2327|nr:YsnF/AvaK domain-containing protein [Noviherbaspirillum pedocola]